ncbi:hypothetical protein COBT_003902 [Conglomerata obtusa]
MQGQHTQTTNTAQHDLASVVNALSDFNGREVDDIYTWERELTMFTTLFNFDENTAKKLLLCKLKEKAQTWLGNSLSNNFNADFAEILHSLKKQFANTNANH